MAKIRFLIDTNILIPLEPTSHDEIKEGNDEVWKFAQLSQECGCSLYIHPLQQIDIDNDKNLERKKALTKLTSKYPPLSPPPNLSAELQSLIGVADQNTNDWIDDNLLAAVHTKAVQFLVTQDQGIHRKARRANLEQKVFDVSEAINYLSSLLTRKPEPTPSVRLDKAYNLNRNADIFSSLEADYPGFKVWLEKCATEARDVFVIDGEDAGQCAGIAILKVEDDPPTMLKGKVLKLCTFKVAEKHVGSKFGELLLKNVFSFATENEVDWMFVEVFEKHKLLISLFESFGFKDTKSDKGNNEKVYAKPIMAVDTRVKESDPFEYHRRNGPHRVVFDNVGIFAVPIKPQYDAMLFPERQKQLGLFESAAPYGNSIRKAYLCNANIRRIRRGDLLLFYRSGDEQAVTTLGVVEDTLVSQIHEEIISFVGKVTVYNEEDIKCFCQNSTLAILFRQVRTFRDGIPLTQLVEAGVLAGPPQSIGSIREDGREWLKNRLVA